MGYKTPNIDRIATEGMMFTDYYAEQELHLPSFFFITGQSGITHWHDQGSVCLALFLGFQKADPTIAELLNPFGHATARPQEPPRRPQRNSADRPAVSMSSMATSTT